MNTSAVQDRITAFWDVIAPRYDSPDNVAAPGSADYDHWVDALRSVLPEPAARVLDVGTGTGFVARIAAELGHHVTAIDASQATLDASARDPGLAITFVVGDAVAPAFPAGTSTSRACSSADSHAALDHDYLLGVAATAGFVDVTVTPLEVVRGWETSPGSDLPYALVGYRLPHQAEACV